MRNVVAPSSHSVFMGARLRHTMLRVADLERALAFYVDKLGMRLLRRKDFADGQFTLAFVGYGDEADVAVIELTHNWGVHRYALGTAYGHIAIEVDDIELATRALAEVDIEITRKPGPLAGDPGEIIAFVVDPDGYKIELIQRASRSAMRRERFAMNRPTGKERQVKRRRPSPFPTR